jgi:putative hydrolase of HD superfamily
MKDERLEQILRFALEIDKEKMIGRQTYLSDASRKENDAEHAWHMAVMAVLLSEYANEEIDVLKTVTILLIHDLVEIYAGDTYCYDEVAKLDQKERELQAADKLFSMLPKDLAEKFRSYWDDFEAHESMEARFAYTLDHFQPVMLNHATGGLSWKENGIGLSQVHGRNELCGIGSQTLWQYCYENFITPHIGKELKEDCKRKEFPESDK